MRPATLRLIALIFVLAVALWWFFTPAPSAPRKSAASSPSKSPASAATTPSSLFGAPANLPRQAPSVAGPASTPLPATKSTQRVFRFVLDGQKLTLEADDEISGEFHRQRGQPIWEAGMFCCRLLDAGQRVLAEETLRAPDELCVVLDPTPPGPDGKPQPAQFSPSGPVTFQVRLPKVEGATELKIYRLAGPRPEVRDAEPAGQLLATIPLAR